MGCGGCHALYFMVEDTKRKCYNRKRDLRYERGNDMEINITDNFTLLFDKNNNVAYKALQTLQKVCEESDKVYCYMDKLADMIGSDNS